MSEGGARTTAAYIDAENVPGANVAELLRLVAADPLLADWAGEPRVAKAYAGWERTHLQRMGIELKSQGVDLVDVPAASAGEKSAADVALAMGAVSDVLSDSVIRSVVIISGDGDLAPLAAHLRTLGKRVLGVSLESKLSPTLLESCDAFRVFQASRAAPLTVDIVTRSFSDRWAEVVQGTVARLVEEAGPVAFPVVNSELLLAFGVDDLTSIAPRKKLVAAVADALEPTQLAVYRTLAEPKLWLIDVVGDVPIGAEIKQPSDRPRGPILKSGSAAVEDDEPDYERLAATRVVLPASALMLPGYLELD